MRDAILNRISTRTYQKGSLSETEIDQIRLMVEKYKGFTGPFGISFDFTLTTNEKKLFGRRKIGTYGLIKNVPLFIGGLAEGKIESIVDFGYVFEYMILELTKLGFETCWLGGTFKRKDYQKELGVNEIIPAITPVGHRAGNRSLIDKVIRSAAQSKNRLDFSVLFKQYLTDEPLVLDLDDPVSHSLDLVRRGPSASNKQPWRIFVENSNIHFYLKRTQNYGSNALGYDIQALDIGIALAHFEIGMKYFNNNYKYFRSEDIIDKDNHQYIISMKILDWNYWYYILK